MQQERLIQPDQISHLSCPWKYAGTAGIPVSREEAPDGRKLIKDGAQRTHRILSSEELAHGKQARWMELEVHGNVRHLGAGICQMHYLTALFLSHNSLQTIPADIVQLTHLTILDASFNRLHAIPAEVGEMKTLQHINLAHNELTSLPPELGKLFKLKMLNVTNNPLPAELSQTGNGPQGARRLLNMLLEKLAKQAKPPPSRKWIQIAFEFTTLCYNILSDKYATNQQYAYCPFWALHWEYRKHAILKELFKYDSDVVALQEVESEQYRVLFDHEMKSKGYDGIFAPKSRAKTMNPDDRKRVDGCALFWKKKKFRLIRHKLVEFAQLAIDKSFQHDLILDRVMPRDNIALLAVLEVLPGAYQTETGPPAFTDPARPPRTAAPEDQIEPTDGLIGSQLVVSAAHIHWDPDYCDVKVIQAMMLAHECCKQIEQIAKETGVEEQKVPLIICGDFNSLPDSGVVEFLSRGNISQEHPDLKAFRNELIINTWTTNELGDGNYSHPLLIQSSVMSDVVPHTNITQDFKGMIDYIFATPHSLQLRGVLGGVDAAWLQQQHVVGFPHPHVPSDHIPILAQYRLRPLPARPGLPVCQRWRRESDEFNRVMQLYAERKRAKR